MRGSEDGFTLVELAVVLVVIGILGALALASHLGARERAGDATATSNIRVAVPAMEAYRLDNDGYAGMTAAALRARYSPSLADIAVLSASRDGYCVRAVAAGRTWYKAGPDAEITRAACP